MSWSSTFLLDLSDTSVQPKYILRFNSLPNFIGDAVTISGGYNQLGLPSISHKGPSIRGTSVQPQSWNVSFGSFSVPVVGRIDSLFPQVRKGSIAELYCDLNGNIERIAIGQLRNIRGFGVNWTLEFVDIISAMGSRADGRIGTAPTGNDPDKQSLFYNTGKEVEVTSNWHQTAGNFPTTISVSDVRPFEFETSGEGVARCIDVGGVEFYIKYNATNVTSFPAGDIYLTSVHTISTVIYPSVNSCTNLSIGDKITSAALLTGKPQDIFAKILLSRNKTGVNSFDTYPESYSFGAWLNESLYDVGDANNQSYIQSSAPSITDYKWRYVINSPTGIRSIVDTSALCGQWPSWRQNSITWRGCQDPEKSNLIAGFIATSDIIQINNIDIFDPNQKSVYYRSKNIYGINSSSTILSNLKSSSAGENEFLPAQSIKERDLRFVYGYSPNSAPTDRLRCSIGDLNRLHVWDNRTWSKISLKVKLKFSKLTCGDIIEIQSEYLETFIVTNSWTKTFRAMVLSVDWNIQSSFCSLQIAILM